MVLEVFDDGILSGGGALAQVPPFSFQPPFGMGEGKREQEAEAQGLGGFG